MLIYGYKGDKDLKSDNCNDYTSKNIMSLYNYNPNYIATEEIIRHVFRSFNTLNRFNNSLVNIYEVNDSYIESIDFVKDYLENNLDIENSIDSKCRNIYDHLRVWYRRLCNNPNCLDDIKWQVVKTMKYYEKQGIFRVASINLKRNHQDFVYELL